MMTSSHNLPDVEGVDLKWKWKWKKLFQITVVKHCVIIKIIGNKIKEITEKWSNMIRKKKKKLLQCGLSPCSRKQSLKSYPVRVPT